MLLAFKHERTFLSSIFSPHISSLTVHLVHGVEFRELVSGNPWYLHIWPGAVTAEAGDGFSELGKAPGMLQALLWCSSNSPIPQKHGGSDRKTQENIRVHRLQ